MIQVGPGRGYYFCRDRKYQFGSAPMLAFLRELSDAYGAYHEKHPFGLGDLSLKNGGTPGTENGGPGYHSGHKWGSCVDIYIIGKKERGNSIANPDGVPKPTLLYTDKENYDFERTCALMDIILQLRDKYPMYEVIYEDERVRPETRLAKWYVDHSKPVRCDTAAHFALFPDENNRFPELEPRFEPPPIQLLRKSKIRLKAPSDHKDHIHIQLS